MSDNLVKLNNVIDMTPAATLHSRDVGMSRPAASSRQVKSTGLYARLDKAGEYVLCGQIDCGARMARFVRIDDESQPEKFLEFPPGWDIEHDGTWRLSNRARQRMKKGQTAKLRRYPSNHRIIGNDAMDSAYDVLPVRGICPTCGRSNLVTAEAVGVLLVIRVPAPPERYH